MGELDGESALQAHARWLPLQANRHGSPVGKDLGRVQVRCWPLHLPSGWPAKPWGLRLALGHIQDRGNHFLIAQPKMRNSFASKPGLTSRLHIKDMGNFNCIAKRVYLLS